MLPVRRQKPWSCPGCQFATTQAVPVRCPTVGWGIPLLLFFPLIFLPVALQEIPSPGVRDGIPLEHDPS